MTLDEVSQIYEACDIEADRWARVARSLREEVERGARREKATLRWTSAHASRWSARWRFHVSAGAYEAAAGHLEARAMGPYRGSPR